MLLPTLAQSSPDPKFWLYFALLLLVLIVGGLFIFALRRKLFAHDDHDTHRAGGGLLEHLDELKRSGKMSKEEYDITRQTIIERASRELKENNEPTDS